MIFVKISNNLIENYIKCWGKNSNGELGNGTKIDSINPNPVLMKNNERLNSVKDVVVGEKHSCSLMISGKVYCWGDNSKGQLGYEGGFSSVYPIIIKNNNKTLLNINAISAGSNHTCASNGNSIYCWGDNSENQTEYDLMSSFLIENISAKANHTCISGREEGKPVFKCWGNSYEKQALRTNTFDTLTIWTGSNNTCAITTNNDVECWGDNAYQQLSKNTRKINDIDIGTLSSESALSVISIEIGDRRICILKSDMSLRCWGQNWQQADGVGYLTGNKVRFN